MENQLKKFTILDIRALKPCYDPARFLPENWTGTVIDLLELNGPSSKDKFWVVFREDFISARTLRLFAVWCAREALKLESKPDPRSVAACDMSERYANGMANIDELNSAMAAARDAQKIQLVKMILSEPA